MLKLPKSEFDAIRRHGEETYPHECCGVLLGTITAEGREVATTASCRNTRTDSLHDRYGIDPVELVRIQRNSREQRLEIVGFYHSHPDHPALWSPTDLAEAHWIGCSYIITSVASGVATDTNSFELIGSTEEDKAFHDEEIAVT
jgi:proteasome lid subunit RPN8/RPN11